ncbi:MAG: twin-arginine translocation pathway signal protein, partial [Pseudomonadota bacterium]
MATRRSVLQTGAAAVVILGAGAAAWSLTRAPTQAREPWSKAGTSFGDARLDALSYAILAPNPHNMQPWRIRLDGKDALSVYCDLDRLLPQTDPPNRQITIGFGCFLELLRQAAANKGIRTEVTPF